MKSKRLRAVSCLAQSCTANQQQSLGSGRSALQFPQGQGEQIPHGQEPPGNSGVEQIPNRVPKMLPGLPTCTFSFSLSSFVTKCHFSLMIIILLFLKKTPRQPLLVNIAQSPSDPHPAPQWFLLTRESYASQYI